MLASVVASAAHVRDKRVQHTHPYVRVCHPFPHLCWLVLYRHGAGRDHTLMCRCLAPTSQVTDSSSASSQYVPLENERREFLFVSCLRSQWPLHEHVKSGGGKKEAMPRQVSRAFNSKHGFFLRFAPICPHALNSQVSWPGFSAGAWGSSTLFSLSLTHTLRPGESSV